MTSVEFSSTAKNAYIPVAGCSGQMIYGFPSTGGYYEDWDSPKTTIEAIAKNIKQQEATSGKKFFIATVNHTQDNAAKALEQCGYSKIGEFPSSHGGGEIIRLYCKGLTPNKEIYGEKTSEKVARKTLKFKTKLAAHAAVPKIARGVLRATRAVRKNRRLP